MEPTLARDKELGRVLTFNNFSDARAQTEHHRLGRRSELSDAIKDIKKFNRFMRTIFAVKLVKREQNSTDS